MNESQVDEESDTVSAKNGAEADSGVHTAVEGEEESAEVGAMTEDEDGKSAATVMNNVDAGLWAESMEDGEEEVRNAGLSGDTDTALNFLSSDEEREPSLLSNLGVDTGANYTERENEEDSDLEFNLGLSTDLGLNAMQSSEAGFDLGL
jgi:hypothetical protein